MATQHLQHRHLSTDEIAVRVCDIFAEVTGIDRRTITPESALIEDLHCDSLRYLEVLFELERTFGMSFEDVSAKHDATGRAAELFKKLFTRPQIRVSHIIEIIYIAQGTEPATPRPQFSFFRRKPATPPPPPIPPAARHFTQLDGRWNADEDRDKPLLEDAGAVNSLRQYRRRSDGMLCVQIPNNAVEIGSDIAGVANADEQPRHFVELDSFIIDMEPVSTTAYCRFLNSIPEVSPETLADWFVLQPGDDRVVHMLIEKAEKGWRPLIGTERWPMILVSWYGANAYSLWANRHDWRDYRAESTMDNACMLPSEAQWEYAARGAKYREFPWGEESPTPQLLQVARHERRTQYQATTLPLANVNEPLGVSPFGLHHMAGNVWQWCRDWYSPTFYHHPEANLANPENRTPTGVRSERGGSWVGTAELCRSSYRRGRATFARGRCLGFRCLSDRRR